MKVNKLIAALFLILGAQTVLAQGTTHPVNSSSKVKEGLDFPYAFVGIQGGGQTTFTNYNNWQLITPTASVSAGVHFNNIIAARLHVNGLWNKGGVCHDNYDATYKYNYATTNLDLMINMVNLISKVNRPVKLYLIGGVGLNYAWDYENVSGLRHYLSTNNRESSFGHNFRVGTMLGVNVARNWSVNLEMSANSLSDRYNRKLSGGDDWQLTAQVGVAYKIPLKKKKNDGDDSKGGESWNRDRYFGDGGPFYDPEPTPPTPVIVIPPQPDTPQPDTPQPVTPQPDTPQKQDTSKQDTVRIFFNIRQTEITAKEQRVEIEKVVTWLEKHPTAKVTVTGYADEKTGNRTINARYAKQRAESVTRELTEKYGIEASRITTDSKGDTVQPFTENDKNRVTIIIAQD